MRPGLFAAVLCCAVLCSPGVITAAHLLADCCVCCGFFLLQLARNIVEVSAGNVELAEINWK